MQRGRRHVVEWGAEAAEDGAGRACAKSMPLMPARLPSAPLPSGPKSTTTGPKLAHLAALWCAWSEAPGWRGTSRLSGAGGEASPSSARQKAGGLEVQAENPQLWSGLRRAAEATASFQDA